MPADLTRVPLLDRLHKLRRDKRRIYSSFITTYALNLPFYEDVVLRHLQAAGSRLNVVLVDAGELGKAFLAKSTMPRRAGVDYVLVPVHAGGAFHPKILALFSDQGMSIAVGSHNLTEAGFGRNSEISITFGFDKHLTSTHISRPVTNYLLQCAGNLAPGDRALSERLAERLRLYSGRGPRDDDDVAFAAAKPGGALLNEAFTDREFKSAKRLLIVGPYFDDDLRLLGELRKRAPSAKLIVALQRDYSIMKRPELAPARTRLCNADALVIGRPGAFLHGKAIILDGEDGMVTAIGSANPSYPAWLGEKKRGNFEAIITIRNKAARKAIADLGLDQLWDAPTIDQSQLKEIASRSKKTPSEDASIPMTIAGLWQSGWVKAELEAKSDQLRALWRLGESGLVSVDIKGARIADGVLHFPVEDAGVFSVVLAGQKEPVIVIACKARELGRTLVSGPAARLIDELGRLDDGTAPGQYLLNLCEQILLQPEEKDESPTTGQARNRQPTDQSPVSATYSPRGISIHDADVKSHRIIAVDLDISTIITLLLKDLAPHEKENGDPTAQDEDESENKSPSGAAQWEDIVRAVRPRVTNILNRLAKRVDEPHSPKWKYERVLMMLALLKRLRKLHPGSAIPFTGLPERLANDQQVKVAFKLAMRCWFARDNGVIGTLERMGGIDLEHEHLGRGLLLWAAYESGSDVALPSRFHVKSDEFRAFQADRTDALISSIAACGNSRSMERARREIFDRGNWTEPRDRSNRIDSWFRRHTQVGQAIQRALAGSRPPQLPTAARSPSVEDIVVWTQEPGWPRFAEVVNGHAAHLVDVGDQKPLKIAQNFVQPVDIDALRIRSFLHPES